MKRTILSVAYPLTEVGVDAVGGSEQILATLDRTITAAGHRSIVIAAEGSRVQGTLVPSPGPREHLNDAVRKWGQDVHRRLIRRALDEFDVDLVHMHSLDFHTYLPPRGVNVLATLHLPPDWYPREIFHLNRERVFLNCVSYSQHRRCPAGSRLLHPIPNGVDVDQLSCTLPKRDYALALGRICPEKGFHFALDAARAVGLPLLLAGEVFPYQTHLHYFDREIAPRLDGDRIFLGPVKLQKKKRLLAQARCLLIPSTVAETSSLVAMEALACGTPVIAFDSGALPEIVEHGRTGFIVSNGAEMAEAIRLAPTIPSERCRESARRRFSAEVMGARYLGLYQELIGRDSSREKADFNTCTVNR